MKYTFQVLSIFIFNTLLSAQSKQLIIELNHLYKESQFYLDQNYELDENKTFSFNRMEYYLNINSVNQLDGTSTSFEELYLLVDPTINQYYLGNYDLEELNQLNFHIGVSPEVNHNDPTEWANGHPLAPQNPSMHWGWAAGYRFIAAEGMVDTDGDEVLETALQYHAVSDDYYTEIVIPVVSLNETNIIRVILNVNYDKLFENINSSLGGVFHGVHDENLLLVNNFAMNNVFSVPADLYLSEESLPITYNNPFSKLLQIETKHSAKVDLFNAAGQFLSKFNLNPGQNEIDTEYLSEGFYFIILEANGIRKRKKLIKQ
tara:strand:+ start:77 stop:1027 length:951 start_codon:yes stop_codon:yes gene_type:complete